MTGLATLMLRLMLAAAVFIPAERLLPHRRGDPTRREGRMTDVISYFANAVLYILLLRLWLALGPTIHLPSPPWHAERWPLALQAVAAVGVGSLVYYWAHRAMHHWPALWRFHAVHHSSTRLDWLATYRGHVGETLILTPLSAAAMTLLGLSSPAVAIFIVYRFFETHIEHCNVRVPLGPFKWVLPSPWFHHWHHATDAAAWNRNFSPYPLWDVLFGTAYMPARAMPSAFGVADPVPCDYLGQLAYPFGFGRRVSQWSAPLQDRLTVSAGLRNR